MDTIQLGIMLIVNLSAWASIDALWDFSYRSEHKTLFAGRNGWFERLTPPTLVLWWIPAGWCAARRLKACPRRISA